MLRLILIGLSSRLPALPRRFVMSSAKFWLYSLFDLSANLAFDAILCLACAHHSLDDATLRFACAHHTLVVNQGPPSYLQAFHLNALPVPLLTPGLS